MPFAGSTPAQRGTSVTGLADLVWDADGEPGLLFDVVEEFRIGIGGGFEACELG
ncbi:MAG: hypothetical protein HYU28_01050 [Actinobacteria bacterium]|nr:hypothetical protein [Actinomycetota bacterium]